MSGIIDPYGWLVQGTAGQPSLIEFAYVNSQPLVLLLIYKMSGGS